MKDRIIRVRIHDFVSLYDYGFIQELIDTSYFQRLRRSFQLDVCAFVYLTATHTRLSHSLGAMNLFGRIFDNLHRHETNGSVADLRGIGKAAILLHDTGHGPLSHVSEEIFGFKHEDFTVEILKSTEIKMETSMFLEATL